MHRRIGRLIRDNTPTRDQLAQSKLVNRYAGRALHGQFWRFTRRSVPRGVGIGLLVGIFLMIPGLQIIGATLVSIPFRANVPIAAGMTFLSNPATTPFFLIASLWVGNSLGFHADVATFYALTERGAGVGEWTAWLLSDAAPALVAGLFIIGAVAGLAGYFLTRWFWRWRIGRKWRHRSVSRSAPAN